MYDKEVGYFKSFDQTRIYYEMRGKGFPLVFLYGVGASINHWYAQVKHFSSSFQTVVFDYRSHHKSDISKNLDHLSIECLAKDLHGLLSHLNITRASFFGHSMGAQVLAAAYKMDPNAFEKLIFINSFISNPSNNVVNLRMIKQLFYVMDKVKDKWPNTLNYIWRKVSIHPAFMYVSGLCGGFNIQLTPYKDVEIYGRGVEILDIESFLVMFENMMNYDGQSLLCQIRCPTMVIAGERDSITP